MQTVTSYHGGRRVLLCHPSCAASMWELSMIMFRDPILAWVVVTACCELRQCYLSHAQPSRATRCLLSSSASCTVQYSTVHALASPGVPAAPSRECARRTQFEAPRSWMLWESCRSTAARALPPNTREDHTVGSDISSGRTVRRGLEPKRNGTGTVLCKPLVQIQMTPCPCAIRV